MARTKQRKVVRYGRTSQETASHTGDNSRAWDAQSNSSAQIFSQFPQVGSQMPAQRLRALVPYDDSSQEKTQNSIHANSVQAMSQKRRAIVVHGSQRQQVAKKRKYRPGTKALMEIRKYQKSTALLIQRAPFLRTVKDLVRQISRRNDLRIQADAVSALQEASEAFIVTMFEAANLCTLHARRVTVMPRDFHLVREILSLFSGGASHF